MQQTLCHLETVSHHEATPWGAHFSPARDNYGTQSIQEFNPAWKPDIADNHITLLWVHLLCLTHRHTETVHWGSTGIFSTDISRQVNFSALVHNPSFPFARCTSLTSLLLCPALVCILQAAGSAPLWLSDKVVPFGMKSITDQLHKGIFVISKEDKANHIRTACYSPVGLLWHVPISSASP